jgi:muramoyltetrapeptide carboxypeptidase
MILPRALPAGGKIGICAPSGPVKAERLHSAIARLQALGFTVETAPSVFGQFGFRAAPDEIRARELEQMFARRDIDAVFCTRGGTGAGRLLAMLDTDSIARSRKPFLGFSDVTVLQWCLFARHGFVSFTGPLAVEFDGAVTCETERQAFSVLAGAESDLLHGFSRDSLRVLRGTGRWSAPLLPGNLTMITTLLGTPYLPDLSGRFLLIEDVNEPLYRVDRMLFHLRNAGMLQHLAGLITGDLGAANEAERQALDESLLDATRGTDYPIVTGLPHGHGPERMTLPVGAVVDLNVDALTLAWTPSLSLDLSV